MARGAPWRVALSSAPRKLEPPQCRRDLLRHLHRLPAAATSDTGVPNFLMALLRRNRR
jgi:hypothetical protein